METSPDKNLSTCHARPGLRQRGAVLVVSLIILLLLTIVGITAMHTTTMEEKMAGNTRDRDLAFQSAEAALRDGEAYIEGLTATSGFGSTTGLYSETDDAPDWTSSTSWDNSHSKPYSGTIAGVDSQPRYYIKILAVVARTRTSKVLPPTVGGTVTIFRITARGVGSSPNSEVVLQSRYGKSF
jgi:type IV pilus assembly protein PilX